jgi:Na+-driven multidrug efflux pump
LNIVNDIIGTSSVSIIVRYYGSGDKGKTIEAIEQTIIFKFLLALIVGIVMSFFIPYILSPLAGNKEVLELSTVYGRIRLNASAGIFLLYGEYCIKMYRGCKETSLYNGFLRSFEYDP